MALYAALPPPSLGLPTGRPTKARKGHSARPPTSKVATTVDAHPDVVKRASPVFLDELLSPTTTGKDPYFSHFGSLTLTVPPPEAPPPKRPILRRKSSSNLIARWNRVDVPDSVLIAELEELRRSVELADGNLQAADDHGLISESWCNSCACGSPPEDSDQRWRKAQKSAFCRRELIKTELTYLEGIIQLESENPPTLLLAHLPSLIAVSCRLLDLFLADPTASGVGLAFTESEQRLEEAFLPWCSVIGSAFTNPSRSRSTGSISTRKLVRQSPKQVSPPDKRKSPDAFGPDPTNSPSSRGGSSGNAVAKVFRRLGKGSMSIPPRPMTGDNSSTGSLISTATHSSDDHTFSPSSKSNADESPSPVFRQTKSEDLHCNTTPPHDLFPYDSRRYLLCLEANGSREPSRIFSFRDLAILPTQRVMRYALLFRDLLANTPETCCNRPVIEEALAAAMRIAEKCDGVQRNIAFVRCDS